MSGLGGHIHLHVQALCHNCNRLTTFVSPSPHLVILADMCPHCGWNDMVGWDIDRVCKTCQQLWNEDVIAEAKRQQAADS